MHASAFPHIARPTPESINFSWLLKLRWGAIAGQVATITAVQRLYGVHLPMVAMGVVIAVEALSNLGWQLATRRRAPEAWWSATIMLLDTVLLTGLLHLSGGPLNPFSFLYLVQIALAAVILPARFTWALVALSLAGSGSLFLWPAMPLDGLSHADYMVLHLRGMWVAFGVAATFIVYFLMRVRRDLEARELALQHARELAQRQLRLTSLATLAAGAAHELATPLSTIALVAGELDRQLTNATPRHIAEDIALIRAEVARCRQILDSMAAESGQNAGELLTAVHLADVVQAAVARARPSPLVQVELHTEPTPLRLPRRALTQALQSLLANAQDASGPESPVQLTATLQKGELVLDIVDQGTGMDALVLARVGEPFFTTKAVGRGMGLGVFLSRTLLESLGGSLQLSSHPGRGTRARISLTVPA